MMLGRCVFALFVSVSVIAASAPAAWAEVTQSLKGRVQVGAFQDSNVLERLTDEQSDQAVQLFGSGTYRAQLSPRVSVLGGARVGVIRYREISEDSRVMGNANASLILRAQPGLLLGIRGLTEGRDYADSSSSRGFGLIRGEAFMRLPVRGFSVEIAGGRTAIEYRSPGQAQRGNRLDLAVGHSLGAHLSARVRGGLGAFNFDRRATRVIVDQPTVQAFAQRDEYMTVGADLSYLRGFSIQLKYAYLSNESNSFGASFDSHRFEAAVRRRIFSSAYTGAVLVRLEGRDYEDDVSRFDVINFDSEREENNYLLFEAGRPISLDVRVKGRLGWRRNESIFRDQFYDKVTGEIHLEWEF